MHRAQRSDSPARRMVAARVQELICTRGLQPGDLLPCYEELGKELGVSRVTVKRGLDDLERSGLIRRHPFRGTFVQRKVTQVPCALGHIGVIYPASRAHFFMTRYMVEIMAGVTQDAPTQSDVRLLSLRENGLVSAAQLSDSGVDGALLIGVENDDYLRRFARWGRPGVVVDYCSEAAPLDFVACDNHAAARKMAAHLAALGHRRVVYLSGSPIGEVKDPQDPQRTLLVRDSSDARERRTGSLCALKELKIEIEDWALPSGWGAWFDAAVQELRRRQPDAGRPTALLVDSNMLAHRLLRAMTDSGLRVPEDYSVCAVASDGNLEFDGRRLTCCRFDFTGMGRKAIQLLAARRQTRAPDAPRIHRIGFEFVEGNTAQRRES